MAVVEFNIDEFRGFYPNFTDISDTQLLGFAEIAYLLVDNTENSRIPEARRKVLINLAVCHLATLEQRGTDSPVSGQLESAKEGSVSASYFKYDTTESNEWWTQTPCGRAFWQLMKAYRIGGMYFKYRKRCPITHA